MGPLFLSLLLTVAPLAGAALPELACDPDARVVFRARWLGQSTVSLEGRHRLELPWSGREKASPGLRLKENAPELSELPELPDNAAFFTYGQPPHQLHVERSLLSRGERDGIVLLEGASEPRFTLFHCRSR
jgi:hypothetical protein